MMDDRLWEQTRHIIAEEMLEIRDNLLNEKRQLNHFVHNFNKIHLINSVSYETFSTKIFE